jgi:quercetin dioxygenase-like cupin family protein
MATMRVFVNQERREGHCQCIAAAPEALRWPEYWPSQEGPEENGNMEIFRFDRDEHPVSAHGSFGLQATRIASGDGGVSVTCLAVQPGGVIGTHPAVGDQLFLVIAGSGWVAGADGIRHPVQAGQGARWAAGEVHTSGTDTSLTALAIEGSSLRLFEPEHS